MIQTKVKNNNGPKGLAEVRVMNKGLRVILNGENYEVSSEGWDRPTGRYNVTLNQTLDRILFASPPGGTYIVKFKEFGGRQGKTETDRGIPESYIKRGGVRKMKDGRQWMAPDELTVAVQLEVIDPEPSPYRGLNIFYSFPYAFEKDERSSSTVITAKASRLVRIEEFLRIAGLDFITDDIPFSTNVLPWLEKRLQDADRIFTVTLNPEGFVQTLTEVPEYLLPPGIRDNGHKNGNGKAKAKKGAKVAA
jgi:hypothetical protein